MSLLAAAWALPPAVAEKQLAAVRTSLSQAGAEVCLMCAHAELTLARRSTPNERKRRWERARDAADAADAGIPQADSDTQRSNLKATQLLIRELLANRVPTSEVLYLAGLGELAATASPNANIGEMLTTRLRRTEPGLHSAAA